MQCGDLFIDIAALLETANIAGEDFSEYMFVDDFVIAFFIRTLF